MKKGSMFKFIILGATLVAAVLFLLSLVLPDTFGFFTLGWAGFIVALAGGLACLVRGFASKSPLPIAKKFVVYFAVALFVLAGFLLINELAINVENEWIIPGIVVVVIAALLLGFLATGGKKWDTADNKKAGYENYEQRKAERDREEAKKRNGGQ